MKSTGMIRNLDSLGRIVVPAEIRSTRNIEIGDPIEFFIVNDNTIVLRKYTSTECVFCRSLDNVTYYKDQFICSECQKELGETDFSSVEPPSLPSAQSSAEKRSSAAGKKRIKADEMREKLEQAMQTYPNATQKTLAKHLGISQARVSQLMRNTDAG